MIRLFGLLCATALCCLPLAAGRDAPTVLGGPTSEVVVTFSSPPLAGTTGAVRRAAGATVEREQDRFLGALRASIPGAKVRWRYRLVLNGVAVVVPDAALRRLRSLPGVQAVDGGARYEIASTAAADLASATASWQAGLPNTADGIKIGIIDDGVDQRHPFFAPVGYTMPAGFPKGQIGYTSAKVIVARAFAPADATYKNARLPFDPVGSWHGTHVAGIAAGNAGTPTGQGVTASGVAPRAYIGNYKALTIPTDADVGIDGNAPEIVAAIEAAVADGMDVINLSIGEPEITPTRDLVAIALDAAAAAGVVPVVAAGNEFEGYGAGSLFSPGSSAKAITVAAVTIPNGAAPASLAGFSSAGPTPLSLRLKPDVSAPGVSILSSTPGGRWQSFSGTSMASPHIAGTAALLRERHPDWSVAQLKAALIGTGIRVLDRGRAAAPTRGGGGLADPPKADVPLVFAQPASVSFGLMPPQTTTNARIELTDAGGGAGAWDVAVATITATAGTGVAVPPTVTVPGVLDVSADVAPNAQAGDLSGFVVLTRGNDVRRIPFWLSVDRNALAAATTAALRTPGLHAGNTRGKPSLVSRYRYPDVPKGTGIAVQLNGPEQVFRVTLDRPVANFGVVITRRDAGVRVVPRIVAAGNENRLAGVAALPVNINPYLAQYGNTVLAAGAIRPLAGSYDVVFDSPTRQGAGRFTFRFWVNDNGRPKVKLSQAKVPRGTPLVVTVSDAGSGIDPTTLKVALNGAERFESIVRGKLRIPTEGLRRGKHRLRVQVSDYQESRNMENVPPILPNTRVLDTTIVIR